MDAVNVSNEATLKNEIKRLYNVIADLEQELLQTKQKCAKSQRQVEEIQEILWKY